MSPSGTVSSVEGRAALVIEVYADVCCPFTHVGLRSVIQRREQLGRDEVALRVRAWPLELVNGAPLDPAATAEHVDALRSQVAPNLFERFDPSHFPHTSLPALALAAAAYRHSDQLGETVSLELRDLLFEKGCDISRPDVLIALANAHGIGDLGPRDDASVRAEWHQGQGRGVTGSPHFYCGHLDAFCPSLDIWRDRTGYLHLRRDADALDAFLAQCFQSEIERPASTPESDGG